MGDHHHPVPIQDPLAELQPFEPAARQLGAKRLPDARLAAAILARGKLPKEKLQELLQQAGQNPQQPIPLYQLIEQQDLLSREELLELRAMAAGKTFIDLSNIGIADEVIALLPLDLLRTMRALPFQKLEPAREGEKAVVHVALAEPTPAAQQAIQRHLAQQNMEVVFFAADPEKITQILDVRGYVASGDDQAAQLEELRAAVEDGPAKQLFVQIFQDAVGRGASDVHFQPRSTNGPLVVRMRIDGVMHTVREIPPRYKNELVAVIKHQMGMDVANRRAPQSGRVTVSIGGRAVDMRAETLPSVDGEAVVVRLLDQTGLQLRLEDLGFSSHSLQRYQAGYQQPYGAVIITGPTGSGKSSTLYATLRSLNKEEFNILTIEDPVEYRIEGIVQVQADPTADLDFPEALRSQLRCDPDIIMVGEIRDRLTAEIAMRAANTGHLMLTTLHTNQAASAVATLKNMGIPAHVLAEALNVIVAQRLARTLCLHCREPYVPEAEELALTLSGAYPQHIIDQVISQRDRYAFHRPKGCSRCADTGYRGRTAINEVLLIGDQEKELILSPDFNTLALRQLAIQRGMRTLRQDGVEKAMKGITTLEEVRRVTA